MRHSPRLDKVFATASWIIVIVLLFAGVSQLFANPTGLGPVSQAIGITGSKIFYGLLYLTESLALAYSKFRKKKKMRKVVLMIIYLTGFFTTFLSWSLIGFSIKFLDNLLISVAAAGCWLYWTFKTEYLDPDTFMKDYDNLRRDHP